MFGQTRTPRTGAIRLKLKTEDLARAYNVRPGTIRNWIYQGKLVLTGDPVVDFLTLANLLIRLRGTVVLDTQEMGTEEIEVANVSS
jgi:hypothetical protein